MSDETRESRGLKCVLIVDDSAVVRRLVTAYVQQAGHRAVEAKDGQEAIEYAEMDPPDMIILDVRMPVLDGISALKKLRENPRFADTPVIMLTSAGDQETVQKILSAKVLDYVLKDDLKGVATRLREHLQDL